MKILILVMYHESNDENFINYKEVWDKQLIDIKNTNYPIDIKFLTTDQNIDTNYVIKNNDLISNCEENYWHSLLLKVLNGFDFFIKNEYDLVFKTNISTIINFKKFYEYCLSLDKSRKFIYDGVIGKYQDYSFCSGAGMLLNKESVNLLFNKLDIVSDEWTDDIFIGYVLNKLYGIEPCDLLNRFDILHKNTTITNELINSYSHIRIKIRDENYDKQYTNLVYNILHA